MLPGIKGSRKNTFPVGNISGRGIVKLPSFVRFTTKHYSIWSKALIMPLNIWNSVLSYQQNNNISVKTGMFFKEITSKTEFPGYNILLPTFKQVANGICYLLLLISNPE